MTDIIFLDTETMGLDPDAPIWEVAAIRRTVSEDGVEHDTLPLHLFVQHEPRGWMSSYPAPFSDDYHARYDPSKAVGEDTAAWVIGNYTSGAHVIGAVPSFDTERLEKLMRRNRVAPTWHYHLIDVENIVVGYLAGRGQLMKPPWKSDVLSLAVGVDPADYDRHTALGDVLWTQAQWDKVMTAHWDVAAAVTEAVT